MPRKRSTALEKQMIAEAGGRCAWCQEPVALQVHHIDGDSAHTVETNLVALCLTCHQNAERKGEPSPSDLHTRKLELLYHRQRGPVPIAPLAGSRGEARNQFVAENNQGPVHQAERMTIKYSTTKKPVAGPALDSIAAHAAEAGYIKYLRKRYQHCRILEQKYGDRRAYSPAQINNVIEKALGYSPLDAPISSFNHTWRKLHELVRKTLGARKYMKGYVPHDWPEHCRRLEANEPLDE